MSTTADSRQPRRAARIGIAALAAVALGPALAAAPAQASGGDAVRAQGRCSAGAAWELKAKHRDGRIEYELEVDSNRNGQRWRFVVRDNGVRVASGFRRTRAPSGSFSVERRTANRAGGDTLRLVARHRASGQTCRGRLVV